MRVTKTLIIGLGSTGTRIADIVANRVQWELQNVARAPWIEYLCIETNIAEKSELKTLSDEDFRELNISAQDFKLLVEHPEAYDSSIGLTRWMDKDTILKLPGQDVTSGVGNIRMLGRLAFLFETNFNKIHLAVNQRLTELRELTEANARAKRGPLMNGDDPEIEFANGGRLRVVVVGTLCGGTGSGVASDFGYFLQTLCDPNETVTAIFTLPHNKLSTVNEKYAERFKKNAYHALIELNHYHLSERAKETPILFPNGERPNTQKFPYRLTYLVMPRSTEPEGVKQLNRACADRIFVNIFVPGTESYGDSVNATVYGRDAATVYGRDADGFSDRDHRAHVFSTFGLSTVEFPAQQVTEAAAKRLLAHTLNNWRGRPAEDTANHLDAMGISWEGLRKALLDSADGGRLEEGLNDRLRDIRALVLTNPDNAVKQLNKLRAAFRADTAEDFNVPSALNAARRPAINLMMDRLREFARRTLTDYYAGIVPLQEVLLAAKTRLSELKNQSASSFGGAQQQIQDSLDTVNAYHHSTLLRLMGLRRKAIAKELPSLQRSITEEIDARLKRAVLEALLDDPNARNDAGLGVIERLSRNLRPVEQRLENLRSRTQDYVRDANDSADKLASRAQDINGITIFKPESNRRGTVQEEYERCLLDSSGDATLTWEEARERAAQGIIRAWIDLPEAIIPSQPPANDWLLQRFQPFMGKSYFPIEHVEKLEAEATAPFRQLSTNIDVLERWQQSAKVSGEHLDKAKDAARLASPFLDVNPALARRGGRSEIPVRKVLLVPDSPLKDTFVEAVRGTLGNPDVLPSPERFRAVMLEEWFRFPLSGCLSILAENSSEALENAVSTDFPTFWTRNDIGWAGISRQEIEKARKAEEVLAVNVLLGKVELKGGAIELPWEGGLMEPNVRRLPLSFEHAARYLARESRDLDGYSMKNVLELLDERAIGVARKFDADAGEVEPESREVAGSERERFKAFIAHLVQQLNSGKGAQIDGWKRDRITQILRRYFASRESLFEAFLELDPPPTEVLEKCYKRAGEADPHGGHYENDGYYCPCGGLIGGSKQEAARNGWRCYIRPDDHNMNTFLGL